MAELLGEAVLELSTDTKKFLAGIGTAKKEAQKLDKSFSATGIAITAAATASFAAIAAFAKSSLNAYAEQEVAVAKLNTALRNQGIVSERVSRDMLAFASSLQKTTTFSDETIIQTQAMLVSFGLFGKQLETTTKTALDLSVGLGIDLRSATLILGKAFVGETQTLARYGIKIKDGLSDSQKFAAVLAQVNERFGGSAQAQANTYAGRIEVLSNRFNELKERIGIELLPIANKWLEWLDKALAKTEQLSDSEGENLSGRKLTIATLESQMSTLAATQASLERFGQTESSQFIKNSELLKKMSSAREREIALLAEQQRISANMPAGVPRGAPAPAAGEAGFIGPLLPGGGPDLMGEAQKKIDSIIFTNQQIEMMETESLARRLEVNNQFAFAQELRDAQRLEKERELNKLRFQNFRDTLGFISTLAQSKNKELVSIGKAAAAAQATINIAEGVTKAWAIGGPFGGPLAAIVIAAGAAQLAAIAGAGFQEGGRPPVGIPSLVGEGGPELFVPDRPGTIIPNDELRGMGGITIQQSFTVTGADFSDQSAARKMLDSMAAQMRRGVVEAISFARSATDAALLQQGRTA